MKKKNQHCLYRTSQKYVLNLSTHKSGAIIKQHAQMASPVTQPATLHAIRQDNMAVHILWLSLFSRLVNNFLYASHFCHEKAMGGKNQFNPPWVSWLQKSNEQSARLYSQCKKTHYTKYFWGKDRETRNAERLHVFTEIHTKPFKNGNKKKKTPLLRVMLPVYC